MVGGRDLSSTRLPPALFLLSFRRKYSRSDRMDQSNAENDSNSGEDQRTERTVESSQ